MESIAVRRCETLEEFQNCVTLQREIWGEEDLEIEPTTMFVVASLTGGQVLGAFEGNAMVGYTLGVAGLRGDLRYLHSHQTGVKASHRDRGVGRMLKLFQREEALSRGIRVIEWSFDPLEVKNAHFNLNRLGAICRRYVPNLYGITTSPLHRGIPTDRLIAEWFLDSPRVVAAINGLAPENAEAPARIELPRGLDAAKSSCVREIQRLQTRIRTEFTEWFGKGYAAVAAQKRPTADAYVLAPWSEF